MIDSSLMIGTLLILTSSNYQDSKNSISIFINFCSQVKFYFLKLMRSVGIPLEFE